MKSLYVFISCCLIHLVTQSIGSQVTLTENGYENLVISVDPAVTGEDCPALINGLKALIAEASGALCTATDSRAYFKSVNVVVAKTDADKCGATNNTTWERSEKSDIHLGSRHPVSGDSPIVFPHAGCGHPSSLPIHLPVGSILQLENKNRGRELLRQWAHYRYGVFDEVGAHNDPVFPVGYAIPGRSFEVNSCTNEPMNGSWIGSTTCTLTPTPLCNWTAPPESNFDITSSIMYTNDFPNVGKFCTADNHKIEAPNKQNYYCDGRSVRDVVLSHSDFNDVNVTVEPCQQPEFNVLVSGFNGYFIVLDRTSSMNEKHRLKYAAESLAQFLWYLPDGTLVYLLTFGESFEWMLHGIALNSTIKRNVIAKLDQLLPSTSDSNEGLGLALLEATAVAYQGLDVILITAASREPINETEVLDAYGNEKITAHVLSYGTGSSASFYPELASKGLYTIIPDCEATDPTCIDGNNLKFTVGSLQAIYSRTISTRIKIFEAGHYISSNQTVGGSFLVDSTGSQLVVVFTSLSPEIFIILKDGNLVEYRVKAIAGAKFRRTDPITNFSMGSTWTYSVENAIDSESTIVYVDVWIENPSGDTAVVASAWTNAVENKPLTLDKQPVIIYSQILQNRKPVMDVVPIAKVYGKDLLGETRLLQEVVLKDGGPYDITEGDGIYSGHLLPYSNEGSAGYSVIVEVRSQAARTCQGYFGNPSATSKIGHENCSPIGSFSRYLYEAGFHLVPDLNSTVDEIPPERIRDLTLVQLNPASNAGTLRWTVPRDDYGFGGQVIDFVLTAQAGGRDPLVIYQGSIPPTTNVLSTVQYNFFLPAELLGNLVLLRVHSIDTNGNTSPASNIVPVFVPFNPAPTTPPSTPYLDWIDYVLLGICCFLAVSLTVALMFLCCGVRCCSKSKRKIDALNPENRELQLGTQDESHSTQLRRDSSKPEPVSDARSSVPEYALPVPVTRRRTRESSVERIETAENSNSGFLSIRTGTRNSQSSRVPFKPRVSFRDPRFMASVVTSTTFGYSTAGPPLREGPVYANVEIGSLSPSNPLPRPTRTAPQPPAARPRSSRPSSAKTQAFVVNLDLDMLESIV